MIENKSFYYKVYKVSYYLSYSITKAIFTTPVLLWFFH
jgi:hypothetical protein